MNRISARACALVLFAGLVACAGNTRPVTAERVPDRMPRNAWRFNIAATSDSTVSFDATGAPWLRKGSNVLAVDPTRRDAFVARMVVMDRHDSQATSVITGQVRPVEITHVVLAVPPSVPLFRQRDFWIGAGLGLVMGVGAGALLR